ncbi:MAG: pitrilysin family protein [Bacteroidota bacterium]
MKKLIIIILALVCGFANAQVDRTKAPKPAPAREIKIGEYQTFTLKNGLQVFVVENHKLPRVQFSLQLKNDPILEKDKVGYVELTGNLIGTGTTTRSKAQLDEEVDFIGATLNTSWNGIFASSLTKHRDKLLELMSDVLFNPAFSPDELAKLKTQKQSELASDKDDPNAIIANVRTSLVYGKDHTYGEIETEKTIEAFTLEDCKAYFNTYFKPNNAYLAIVGDIDLKTATAAAEKYFGKWTQGAVTNPTYAQPQPPAATYVALVDRPNSVQSVISVAYPVNLKTGSQEAIKARVLNQILGGSFSARLMQNLREAHGYTYGASSQLTSDFLVGQFQAGASVRNEVTDSSVFELMNELNRIVNEPVTDNELLAAKASIAGAFGRSLESPQTIASFAVNTAKYNLPKDYYNNYLKSIDAVSIADVQSTAKQYILPTHAHIVVVGKGSDISDKLKKFGAIRYFDIYGNEVAATKPAKPLPAGLTAQKVIDTYINAVGGLKTIQAAKSSKLTYKASFQGNEVMMINTRKDQLKMLLEIKVGPQTMQSIVSDGKNVSMTQMGMAAPVADKDKESTIYSAALVEETNIGAMGAKLTLVGIEEVEGKDAYVVEIALPKGEKQTAYYDTQSGFKVQQVTVGEGPDGAKVSQAVKFSDYKDYSGIKFPTTFTLPFGPLTLKFELTEAIMNPKVDDAVFKVQ